MNRMLNYKPVIAAVVSVGILLAIFVPFQKAEAFILTTTLPNATGNTTTQSTTGETFNVSITVAAGELISLSSIDTIVDNGLSSVARTTFKVSGSTASYSSGTHGIIKDNTLTLTLPSASAYGHGYGYGLVSNGITGPTGYSYAFPYRNASIAGNSYGYGYAIGNGVTGFVGPGTIVISGTLNTALMAAGSHTLDVVVNTGADTNPSNLVAPQLTFTVNANSNVVTNTVSSGTNVSLPSITVPGSTTPITITISNVQTGGTIAVQVKTSSALQRQFSNIFTATGPTTNIFNVGSSSANSIGVIFDIDISSITLGSGATIDVTIPYDTSALPNGFNENNVKFFHWNGSTWEDKTLSVNTSAHTVTGRLTSLSPVVAGFIVPSASVSTSGGGGGSSSSGGGSSSSGGAGGSSIDLTTTYEDSYFVNNPLAKIQFQNSGIVNAKGVTVYGVHSGQQVNITSTIKNYQKTSQNYAMIVQILDKDGFTTEIGWVKGTLASGDSTDAAKSWTTGEPGSYTVKLFVWNGVTGSPSALSEITTKNFVVS